MGALYNAQTFETGQAMDHSNKGVLPPVPAVRSDEQCSGYMSRLGNPLSELSVTSDAPDIRPLIAKYCLLDLPLDAS